MYQFGERLLVYNVNVCILQFINQCICQIYIDRLTQILGATNEPRRKVTEDFDCRR